VHDGDGVGHGAGFLGGVGHEDGGDVLTADAFGGQGAQVVAQGLRPRATVTGA